MTLKSLEDRLLKSNPDVRRGYRSAEAIARTGTLLRKLREHRKLTQRQLEAVSGVQQAEISRIEAGRAARGLTISRLKTIADAQDVDVIIAVVPKRKGTKSRKVNVDGTTPVLQIVI
jgi:transcriptional regulator with XRE-family HTH domain